VPINEILWRDRAPGAPERQAACVKSCAELDAKRFIAVGGNTRMGPPSLSGPIKAWFSSLDSCLSADGD